VTRLLTIRAAQMEAFRADRDRQFAVWMRGFLRDNQPKDVAALDDATVERRALAGLRRARRHQLKEPASQIEFIGLMFKHAPNFDRQARLADLLAGGGDARFRRMRALAGDADWDDADGRRDESAWEE
jgi:hypothetical protein